MKKILDITVPLDPGIPIWPGSDGFRVTQTLSLKAGDVANVSSLQCDVHTGTHVDAPRHAVEDGDSVEQLSLDTLVGVAQVIELPKATSITKDDLRQVSLETGVKRLLIKTSNSDLWKTKVSEFNRDYVALTADAAQWIVDSKIALVGVDYLSVQRYRDSQLTHQILLQAGVIIIESLNLNNIAPGMYELICLPVKIVGCEGAPARTVLRTFT